MKILVDFLPILLFFVVYKLVNIYWATAAAMAAALVQVLFHWFKYHRLDRMQVITLVLITLLGGMTLLLHNEIFIKWKPTAINWAFALIFLGSHFIGKKPLIQRMLDQNIQLPATIWTRLNIGWTIFFLLMGIVNLFVAYYFDTDIWVDFKLFGMLGLTLLFVILQSLYLAKHATLAADHG
jgi:intracellular septation protein